MLYADVVLGEMAALNNLDASPARLASETLKGSSPDPSLLVVPIDETFPTVSEK